jgi:hypothetical protein
MKQVPILLSIASFLLLCSCSSVPKSWKGANSGKNQPQATSVTHNYALKWVDEALVKVLDQMEIMVIESTPSPDGTFIKAATLDKDITIDIKSVSQTSTRMQIDVKLTDNAESASIGNEIMIQTEKYLLNNSQVDTSNLADGYELIQESLPTN